MHNKGKIHCQRIFKNTGYNSSVSESRGKSRKFKIDMFFLLQFLITLFMREKKLLFTTYLSYHQMFITYLSLGMGRHVKKENRTM